MKKIELAILVGLVLSIVTCSITSFAADCVEVREDTIRLHILANSDTEADQALKLLVRDAVLTQTADIFSASRTKAEAVEKARAGTGEIVRVAEETLSKNGCGDAVRAEVTNMFFATRQYGGVVMPAGRYDAVRVYIGEAEGHNWWCVMFPPMCLPAAAGKSKSEQAAVAENSLIPAAPEYEVKFAVVEAVETIKEKWRVYKEKAEASAEASVTEASIGAETRALEKTAAANESIAK